MLSPIGHDWPLVDQVKTGHLSGLVHSRLAVGGGFGRTPCGASKTDGQAGVSTGRQSNGRLC
jgi:hypothetical protein